jgi:hypothetical protein
MPVPVRIICEGDGTVVVGIVIDESVLRIETVIARVGAPIAPVREMPCRPRMHGATYAARSKVRCLRRSAHAAENGRCNSCRDDHSLHAGATHHYLPKMNNGPGLSPKPGRDGKSQRQDWLSIGGRLSLMVSAVLAWPINHAVRSIHPRPQARRIGPCRTRAPIRCR